MELTLTHARPEGEVVEHEVTVTAQGKEVQSDLIGVGGVVGNLPLQESGPLGVYAVQPPDGCGVG